MSKLTMDKKGRLPVGPLILNNGVWPSRQYEVTFGPNQTVILTPIRESKRLSE